MEISLAKRVAPLLVKWYMKCFIYWTANLKSSKPCSLHLWTQFKQLRIEAWKSQDFNGVWTRDLVIPVRRSNQLSYGATDVGSWSFVSSNEPVKNGCEVIYEMFHILNCGLSKPWSSQLWTHDLIRSSTPDGVRTYTLATYPNLIKPTPFLWC